MGIKIDSDTVHVGGGDTGPVDQAASAKANLDAVGQDLKKMLPDKTAECVKAIFEKGGGDYSGIGKAFAITKLPIMVAADVVEVAAMPIVAVKDAVDAAVHGVIAGFQRVFHHKK